MMLASYQPGEDSNMAAIGGDVDGTGRAAPARLEPLRRRAGYNAVIVRSSSGYNAVIIAISSAHDPRIIRS